MEGVVSNGSGLVELTIDGAPVGLDDSGSFKTFFYIPRSGKSVEIVALTVSSIGLANHFSLNVVRSGKLQVQCLPH